MTAERLEQLMVLVVDGGASPAQHQELEAHLKMHPELAAELEAHRLLKHTTDGWVRRLDAELIHDQLQQSATAQLERRAGVALLLIGLAVLMGFGLVEAMLDETAPLWLRLGMGSSAAGALLLLLSAIRWRLKTSRDDAYKEIVR